MMRRLLLAKILVQGARACADRSIQVVGSPDTDVDDELNLPQSDNFYGALATDESACCHLREDRLVHPCSPQRAADA